MNQWYHTNNQTNSYVLSRAPILNLYIHFPNLVGWLVNKITQKVINGFDRYFTCGWIYRRNKQGITISFIGQNIKHIQGGIIDKMEEIQLKYIKIHSVDSYYFHGLRHRILDTT